jgi:hypothetical protein
MTANALPRLLQTSDWRADVAVQYVALQERCRNAIKGMHMAQDIRKWFEHFCGTPALAVSSLAPRWRNSNRIPTRDLSSNLASR